MNLEVPELLAPVDDNSKPTPTPLTDAIRSTFDDEREDFVNSLKTVSPINPDTYGKAARTQQMIGIPASTLYRHQEQMAELERGNQYAAIYDRARKTANALRDGNLAAVAQDDLETLANIEGAASDTRFNEQSWGEKMLGAIRQQWIQASQSTNLSDADSLERIRTSFDAVDAELVRATEAGQEPFAAGNAPNGFAAEYLRSTPEQRQIMRDNLVAQQGELVGRVGQQQKRLEGFPVDPGARRIQELKDSGQTSFDATLEAITEQPGFAFRQAGAAAATSAPMLVGGAIGGIPTAAALGFQTERDVKFADVIREAGVDFNDPAAVLRALQDDELIATARDKAIRKAAGTTAVDALGMFFAGRLLSPTSIGGRQLSATNRELVNLAVQFPVQGLTEAASEAAGQFAAEGQVDAGEVLLEGVAGSIGSSADVMAFGGKRIFETLGTGLRQSREARVTRESLSIAAENAVGSKTRQRDPDTFRKIAEQQLAGSKLEQVWIPAEELQRLNQDGLIDLPSLLANVSGLEDQFGDALVRGGSVSMKGADYLTYLADVNEQLASSVRTSADGMSTSEAKTWSQEQEEQLTQLAEEFRAAPDAQAQVVNEFTSDLVRAGYRRADAEQYAALHGSVLNNLAERTGQAIEQLTGQFPLQVRRQGEQEEQVGQQQRLEQGGKDDNARGFISFTPRGQADRKFAITLGDKRDLSTVTHELGHFYLEVAQDLALGENAPQQIKDDVSTIRSWVGAEEGKDLTTEQHEQFARGFERYLAEGKAPAPELASAFARFKRWLMAIYKHLSRLNVDINDDIRKVFDRIVATDQQIQDAEQVAAALPLFKDAEAAGMTPEEFAAYQNSVELAHTDARDSVEEEIVREEGRRASAEWREKLDRIREEVAEEVDLQPEYIALKALRSGKMPDGTEGTLKLNSAELADRYGSPAVRKLAFTHSKTGQPLDIVASMLGFESGDAMVKALMDAPPRSRVIEEEALRRMEERNGPRQTGEAAERAMNAVHNDRRAEVLGKELRRLAQVGNRRNITTQQILKEAARRVMSERKVRDIQPGEYQRAEAKASRQSFDAFTRGDLEGAYEAKQRQLLNFYLYREAVKARDEVETIVARLNRYTRTSTRQRIGKAGGDYLDQIDAVMEQYEFRNVSLRQLDKAKSFGQWYNDQVSAGNDPYVPEFILNTMGRTNYKELSLAQLQELDEFVSHLNHLASTKGKLQANRRIKDQKEAENLLIRAMRDNLNKGKPLPLNESSRTLPQAMSDWLSEANSSLMKLEQIIEQADGGDPNGAWSTIWWQPLAEAQARRDDLNRDITNRLMQATDEWFRSAGSRAGQKVKINSLGKSLDYNGILAVALNSGNASNLKKMLEGNRWGEHVHQEILDHMREEDWRFVSNLWEIVNSLWPEIVALEKQVNGIAPAKVEGIPVQTPFGVVQGGYWPLVYDFLSPEYSRVQANLGHLSPLNEQGGVRATTPRGHTKARVDGFSAPIVLDTTIIANHLSGVIHDLTHRVAIADARKLISAPLVRQVMNERMGRFQAQQFVNVLDGIANDLSPGSARGIGVFRRTMSALRSNASVAWMGYSVTTMLNQLGGGSQALEYFAQKGQRKDYMRALAKFAMNPISERARVMEMSGEMRNRSINLDPAIREAVNRVVRVGDGRIGGALTSIKNGQDAIKRWAFVPMQAMQSIVDTPVWMAAYEAEGGVNNHDVAVQAADRAVRLTQMAGGAKDLAPIQQNELAKFFLMVYGYASLLWNRNVDIARSATASFKQRDAKGILVAMERFVYLNIIPTILAGAISGKLPDGDGEDDPKKKGDTWPEYIAIQTLLSVTNGIPLARDAAQGAFSDFGYGGASPLGGGIDALIKATNSSKTEALVTNMTTATGMLLGLPSSQINRATRTFFDVQEGEMEADGLTIARGVLFGPPPKKD
ncbi:hypothetical protein [Pseudomonas sp. Marseille-P9655]|uniref:hypothetical protein n=1 Tax=Pseudomonas sp. Marseille-P9655 TaxID=2866591 RepID=UPI001CE474A6|nr:hypothetical protein [Pseudomonas sp. Marseille-P9655]